MTQEEKRLYLIRELLKERGDSPALELPKSGSEQKRLLEGTIQYAGSHSGRQRVS